MKNTERFTGRVDNYIRYRPHYPEEIILFLKKKIDLNPQSVIADIGSGTGISSELFLAYGNKVYAVEPNQEMRNGAEELFKADKNFVSVAATAENTSLEDHSIDLIIAGQAFHWFDKTASKKEFRRIAAPGAHLVLFWNERKLHSPFQQAYEEMTKQLGTDYNEKTMRNVDEDAIRDFFSPQPYSLYSLDQTQSFDFEGLKGRLFSCSYAPPESHANYMPILKRLEQLFEEFQVDSKVEFEYDCKLYYGNITSY